MPNHCAMIGDIKQSRDIKNWPEIFHKLTDTLEEVNSKFAEDILIPFNPTVGDEFQGALKTPEHAYDVYTFIKASIPVHIYFGMGFGSIEKIQPDDKGLRGSAFYRGRSALDLCKEKGLSLNLKSSDEDTPLDKTVNTILSLLHTIENSWTDRQTEIINLYRIKPDWKLAELAQYLDITQPAISKVLRTIGYQSVSEAEDFIRSMLKDIEL